MSPEETPAPALLEQIASFSSLLAALRRAFLGRRREPEACAFDLEREERLLALSAELTSGAYRPAPYRYFALRRPKPRLISVASFRDRIVHHALVAALEPLFEPHFIRHSYACRRKKGALAARRQAQRRSRVFPYALQLDVADCFARIDHAILLARIAERVTDPRVLTLCRRIVANARLPQVAPSEARGLPIGNLTSQFWANVYLDPLDHFVRDGLSHGAVLRYMDDVLVFGHTKPALWTALADMRAFARRDLRLTFKDRATRAQPTREGISFLGWRVFPHLLRLDHAAAVRYARRTRVLHSLHAAGRISPEEAARRLGGVTAYAQQGDTRAFRREVLATLAEGPREAP